MIVECPSCLTKFSIDSQQIADIEDPRFNCCRCGSYFELQQIPAEAIAPIQGSARADIDAEEEDGDEWTISSEPAEEVEEAESSQSGSWMLNETMSLASDFGAIEAGGASESLSASSLSPAPHSAEIAASAQRDWTPDPSAELEDLFVPKCKGEQLSLLGSEQAKPGAEGRQNRPQQNDFSPADWGYSVDTSWQRDAEAGEALMTVDWPDATASARRHSTSASERDATGGSDWKRTAAQWGGLARNAVRPRSTASTEDTQPADASGWSFGSLSFGSTSPTGSARDNNSSDARSTSSRLKDAALRSRSSISEPSAGSEERRNKLREMLSLAKARVGEEFEEQVARTANSGSRAQASLKRQAQEREEQAQKRAEEKARKRAKKQQRLIRDITFRKKREIGRLPSSDLLARAPISCIASVPVLLLILVTLAATQLEQFPSGLQQLLRVDAESLPRLPPPGLGIVDLTSSVITLDSGHRALEIRGELLNATTEQFREIMLLASVFNAANEKTKSLVINPQNELQAAQVVALDEEAIDRLQSRQAVDTREVPPNARVPFRIVFPNYDTSDKWFSTSVYSVERSSGEA